MYCLWSSAFKFSHLGIKNMVMRSDPGRKELRDHIIILLFFKIPIVAAYFSSFPLQLMASYLPRNHLQANHYGQTTGSKDQPTSPKL
jgi:hypothetical protein